MSVRLRDVLMCVDVLIAAVPGSVPVSQAGVCVRWVLRTQLGPTSASSAKRMRCPGHAIVGCFSGEARAWRLNTVYLC